MSAWAVQITSGVGPAEVRAFVARLIPALAAELAERGVRVSATTCAGDPDGPDSATLDLDSEVRPAIDDLLGTHAWLHRSPTRGQRARKRWFVGVTLHEVAVQTAVVVDPADVEVTTCRSGGPGGQNVNRTNSAVMIHHRPTGLRIRCETQRSQQSNRIEAFERLGQRLASAAREAQDAAVRARRREHTRVVRGAPVRVWSFL